MRKMTQIVPTITVTTPADYAREIERLSFAPRLHIDIADGEFAPNRTVNLNQVYWNSKCDCHSGLDPESSKKSKKILKQNLSASLGSSPGLRLSNGTTKSVQDSKCKKQIIDLHLMLKKPIDWLHQIVALNPDLVILHAESDDAAENLPRIFAHVKKFGIKCGVALLPETKAENFAKIIEKVDHALIFGGHLGYQGGTADLSQLEKVAQIRELNPGIELAWDGGANAENVAEIAAKGIDVINVGSAVAKTENPEKAYQNLLKLVSGL